MSTLIEAFQAAFQTPFTTVAKAPGRVNLIGEHTDYNGGFVLPSALPHETTIALSPRGGDAVRVISLDLPGAARGQFTLGRESPAEAWYDYLQGVTWAIAEAGHSLDGADVLVSSTVPIGKGLSSSASLEVAFARALNDVFHLGLDGVAIAKIAHRAETGFVGAPVGIMDQMACSLGDRQTALFLDTATLEFERIPLPGSVEIGVIDSGIAHSHASGDYRTRRRECEAAARALGVRWLRDVDLPALPSIESLSAPLGRRARHVITENARVRAAVDAMQRDDPLALGRLFLESHASMRDDFEVSLPAIDQLVEIACRQRDTYGARLTGGGFGGAIVFLARKGTGRHVAMESVRSYNDATQYTARALLP